MLSRKIYNLLFLLPLSVYAQSVLVLDAGHTPQNGGAISATGQYEVSYNDRFVAELKPELEKSGWKVLLTRTPTQERSLKERAEFANRSYADLFLSIHHDSAQLADLQAIQLADKTVYQSKQPLHGFSVFVSGSNPQFEQSARLAKAIGQNLRQIGRSSNWYHNKPLQGENRPFLDKTNGVYQYDGLAVLRLTKMPAVLVEIGVIVDKDDEQTVSQAANRSQMIQAIVRALQLFQR